MSSVFMTLLNMSLTASWLIVAVILLRAVFKRAPKAIRCVLWALVGVRLICPFSIESALSLIPSAAPVPPEIVYAQTPAIESGIPVINEVINPILSEHLAPQAGHSVNPMQIVTAVAAYVWLFGVIAMLIYSLVSYLRLRRRVRVSLCQQNNVYLCDTIDTPFILGLIKPRIYLPSRMAETQMPLVIAHEKAHLRRGDHLWKPLGFALLAVYWFNPLAWIAYILLCRDIELACDERVTKDLKQEEKQAYSETLLVCSTTRSTITACPLAFGEGSVKGRIKSIMSYKKPTFWLIIATIVVCATVGVVFLTNPPAVNTDTPPSPSGNEDTVEDVPHTSAIAFVNYSDNDLLISKALNVDAVRQNKQHRPLYRITSVQELADFKNTFGSHLTLMSGFELSPSFETMVSGYDDAFFQTKTLFLVYVTAGNSSYDYLVSGVQRQGNALCITVTEMIPESGDTMMAGWLIAVTVDKAAVDGCTAFDAVLSDPPANSTAPNGSTTTKASSAATPSIDNDKSTTPGAPSSTTSATSDVPKTTSATTGICSVPKTTMSNKGDTTASTTTTSAPPTDSPYVFTAGQGSTDYDGFTVKITEISADKGLVMTWENTTGNEIGYGTQYHIYRIENGEKISCCTEARMTWKTIAYRIVGNGTGSRTFSFKHFDVTKPGEYVLEYAFTPDGSNDKYTVALPFSVAKK